MAKVAVLAVTGVKRTAGELTYDVEISARESAYDMLARTTLCGTTITGQSYADLITGLGGRLNLTAGTDYVYHAVDNEPDQPAAIRTGQTALQVIQRMAQRLEDACTDKFGRGMYLQRNGVLHIGPRQIPLAGGDPVTIDEPGGLLDDRTDRPGHDRSELPGVRRRADQLDCDGADPAPIQADLPWAAGHQAGRSCQLHPTAAGRRARPGRRSRRGRRRHRRLARRLARRSSGTAVVAYVESVQHKLSRTDGFSTVITGAEITNPTNPWDHHTTITPGAPRQAAPATTASSESRAAGLDRSLRPPPRR